MEKLKHLEVFKKDHKTVKDLAKLAGKSIKAFMSDLIAAYKGS